MPAAIFYKDVELIVDDIFQITDNGQEAGYGAAGTEVRLILIWDAIKRRPLDNNEEYEVGDWLDCPYKFGMYCRNGSRENWGTLEGFCDPHHGFWVDLVDLLQYQYLIKRDNKYKEGLPKDKVRWIKTDVMFKGKSLISKKCKIIRLFKRFSSTAYFVEFEDYIGGCSCDGLGKSGHCLPVNSKFLVKSPKQVENVNEKYIEALKCISI